MYYELLEQKVHSKFGNWIGNVHKEKKTYRPFDPVAW